MLKISQNAVKVLFTELNCIHRNLQYIKEYRFKTSK